MTKYHSIREALELFSVQVGLTNDAATEMLRRRLHEPLWRSHLELELREILADTNPGWLALLANDEYELDEADSEAEAKQLILDLLWKIVFPGEDWRTFA